MESAHSAELPAAGPNVFVEITSRCNLECPFCPHHILSRPQADMSHETYDHLARHIADYSSALKNGLEVTFSLYGEPLLHPGCVDFIGALDNTGARIFLETNGMLLDEPTGAALLEKECLAGIIVGLDAFSAETYARVRPGGDFERIIKNIERLLALKGERTEPVVGVSFLRLRDNDADLLPFYQHWQQKADHALVLGHTSFSGRLTDSKAADFTPLRRTACRRIRSSVTVLRDGSYVLCPQDFEGETASANVADLPLAEAFSRQAVKTVLSAQRDGDFERPPLCCDCDTWYLPL